MTVSEYKKLTVGDEVFVDGILATVIDVAEDDCIKAVTVSYFDDVACKRCEQTMLVDVTRSEDFAPNYKVFCHLTSYHSIYDIGGV